MINIVIIYFAGICFSVLFKMGIDIFSKLNMQVKNLTIPELFSDFSFPLVNLES